MHQSFIVVFQQLPMFYDSFSVRSIHCVAQELSASFLYKCVASRGGHMRQHGLLVAYRMPPFSVIKVTFSIFDNFLMSIP